jgi:hypothetical protein
MLLLGGHRPSTRRDWGVGTAVTMCSKRADCPSATWAMFTKYATRLQARALMLTMPCAMQLWSCMHTP